MKTGQLKDYAPQARRDFIAAVTDRAAFYGLTADKIVEVQEKGDVAIIAGRPFPRSVAVKRKKLEEQIRQHGFEQIMEKVAYTWFNRFVAIRFMELHDYLDHGYRVLSHPEGKPLPEIVEHAEHVELPGLDQAKVIELKLDGNKEAELYRLLLVAQCNALSRAMPFLFESIDDEAELLLPDNLLHSDSLLRKLVEGIDEEDWQKVEVIGWLYQFYISEKYDDVIGKVVASEDIPAATQRFTPNWIVKYLVQNTLGRQWLATYPQSSLPQQMKYYIEPAEQTPEVQAQLEAITPTELNPEDLTLMDPASGSGHILVEAYDLFKAIYQERGYRAKDIPALILKKNLFGLEIDDRAAQLAAFALMMKARADDRRIFDSDAKPNILAFQGSQGMDAAEITHALNSPINKEELPPSEYLFDEIANAETPLFSKNVLVEKGHVSQGDIASLLAVFENAKTFGSLIQVPPTLAAKLPEIEQRLNGVMKHGDLTHASANVIRALLHQARLLARQYDAVVANPPYMGSKWYSRTLKEFVGREYKEGKADLYACFIQRNSVFAKATGFVGMITIPNWMFLSSFEGIRKSLLNDHAIDTFVHNGRGVFGSDFGSCAFAFRNTCLPDYRGTYRRLFDRQGSVASNDELQNRFHSADNNTPSNADFRSIPGSPIAYWTSRKVFETFRVIPALTNDATPKHGMATGNNDRYLRLWPEVRQVTIRFDAQSVKDTQTTAVQWFPHTKGGPFRRWYGNNDYIVKYSNGGEEMIAAFDCGNLPGFRHDNPQYYFRPGITWSLISISAPSFRLLPKGFVIGHKGPALYGEEERLWSVLGYLNSCVATHFLAILSPTVGFEVGQIQRLPSVGILSDATAIAKELVKLARQDWDSFETSWDFQTLPVRQHEVVTLQLSQEAADSECKARFAKMKELEETNNRLFIGAYGLQDELSPEVPDEQITLYRPDRAEDIRRLLSYAIGCMMGRYSFDKPGLIYAESGNKGFDPSQYKTFPADLDGIIPLTDFEWFGDDTAKRLEQFIGTAWPKEHLEENLTFVAESLGPKSGESSRATIRRYLATGFYKHHLSMYRRRPIYWLFSSGKQRAFQALVYLHRYNEGTLSRMRTEYVVPLLGKISARIGHLDRDIAGATGKHRRDLEKEQATLRKQLAELQEYDDKLRSYTDQRIALDLDEGVKVNYAKFGDLLAEVKAVTGGSDED